MAESWTEVHHPADISTSAGFCGLPIIGFNYPHHFTRAFKQRFGMLPSDYQKGAK